MSEFTMDATNYLFLWEGALGLKRLEITSLYSQLHDLYCLYLTVYCSPQLFGNKLNFTCNNIASIYCN